MYINFFSSEKTDRKHKNIAQFMKKFNQISTDKIYYQFNPLNIDR